MTLRSFILAGAALFGAAALIAAPSGPAQAAVTTFGFAGSLGATTNFSVTAGGSTAAFSTTPTGLFSVANSGFYSFGVGLGDYGSFGGDTLTITFSTPVTQSISIPFGVEDLFGLGPDTLTATGNSQVVTATATSGATGVAEGTLFFTPTSAVKTLTLTSANAFAIGSVQVPEPMSLSLLGAGLAGVAVTRRKKRAA